MDKIFRLVGGRSGSDSKTANLLTQSRISFSIGMAIKDSFLRFLNEILLLEPYRTVKYCIIQYNLYHITVDFPYKKRFLKPWRFL